MEKYSGRQSTGFQVCGEVASPASPKICGNRYWVRNPASMNFPKMASECSRVPSRTSAQLDSLEENVDALEDLDEFGGDAFDEWVNEIEEDVDWLQSSAVPELGTDAYEIELVSREVALGDEMGLDAAEGGLNAAEAAQAALNVAEDSAQVVEQAVAGGAYYAQQVIESAGLVGSIGDALITGGISLAFTFAGQALIDMADRNHAEYIAKHHLAPREQGVLYTDAAPPDFPGNYTAARVQITDDLSLPCTLKNAYGGKWRINFKDMYNYERFHVEVNQDRLTWDDPPRVIDSLTPDERSLYLPILRVNGKLRRVPYYPLFELGTEVKLKNNHLVGKITYTYNNNGKNLKPTSDHSYDWTVLMNDDRYGVEAHGMVRFVRPSDFLVRNPNTNRWQNVGERIGDLLTKAKDLELSDKQVDRLLKIASDLVAKGGPTVISRDKYQYLPTSTRKG